MFFGNSYYTAHTVSYSKYYCERSPFRTLLFISETNVEKFCTSRTRKQTNAYRNVSKSVLFAIYTRLIDYLMTSKYASVDRIKEPIKAVSNAQSKIVDSHFKQRQKQTTTCQLSRKRRSTRFH